MAGTQAKRSSIEYATGRVGSRTATKTRARVRRHLRVRKKVSGDAARPRLVVNRSARHIFVQIVDDTVGRTLASASTLDTSVKSAEGDKTAKAKLVGALIADRAREAGISAVVFDRGGYQYHGRVAAKGKDLEFSLGFSHPVVVTPPEGITFRVEAPTRFVVEGIDKQLVGETSARIRKLRKPDPYKAKGVRYQGEVIRRKVGKAGK